MLVFTGTYERTIDGKQRLAIPADIRGMLMEEQARSAAAESASKPNVNATDSEPAEPQKKPEPKPIGVYVSLGDKQILCIYTEAQFHLRAEKLEQRQTDYDSLLEFEQAMYSLSRRVELDKQGRVRLPEDLKGHADLGNDVVLIGARDHMEIHNREEWELQLQEILKKTKNPRRMQNNRQELN